MAEIKVRVGQQPAIKVISSLAGARGLSLSELSDVNIQNLTGGELLIYDSVTNKWNSTKYLTSDPATAPDNDGNLPSNILGNNQIEINGGNF